MTASSFASSPASLVALIAVDARDRRRAIDTLTTAQLADPATTYALRRLLAADRDVLVRAQAAGALGSVRLPSRPAPGEAPGELPDAAALAGAETIVAISGWLVAALEDISPVVRDAAIRALARRRHRGVAPPLAHCAATDTTWWVRRAAVYALGVVAGDDAIGPARAALADPFWRVRHAAVQVLAVRGHHAPQRRPEILADVDGGSADYLRALWGPAAVEDAPDTRAAVPSRLPAVLLDPDPAVVTARLAEMQAPPALALVELLSDPHQALRTLAVARLVEAGDPDAFAAALNWLDEPRIPHVARTVTTMLDGLGDPARALAAKVLDDPRARRGALTWAISWTVATRDRVLGPRAWQRAVDADLIVHALPLADLPAIATAIGGVNVGVAIAAAEELLARPTTACHEVVAALDADVEFNPEVRLRLVAAAAIGGVWDRVERATHDPHPAVRAVAVESLAAGGRLGVERRTGALADPDPMVREAAIAGAAPAAIAAMLQTERDPWIRRAAAVAGVRAASRLADHRLPLIQALAGDADPWIRAHTAELLGDDDHDQLLELAADADPMVQAAIVERLVKVPDEQLVAWLASEPRPAAAQAAATAWLDAARIEQAIASGTLAELAAHMAPEVTMSPSTTSTTSTIHAGGLASADTTVAATPRARRMFGRSGIAVTPLVVSGAFDLAPGSLHAAAEAGVELYFWEPTYAAMTRFLRAPRQRHQAHVVTGTYHADARSITQDVDAALRRLRRDTLDVFLLFWARSPARLDAEAFATLDRLKQAGKIRATGFSTHDRALAIAALEISPWDVVMTRHSAAHPGIETELLPRARAAGAGVLTFSALCYGRMVRGTGAPTAADCYRYSLTQPGVTACISAPRRHRELVENLEVIAQPELAADRIAELRAHGEGVRLENQRFNQLIRQPTRDAAAAAMAMLEAELAPSVEDPAACTAPASLGRSLNSRGHGRASLPSAMLRRGRL